MKKVNYCTDDFLCQLKFVKRNVKQGLNSIHIDTLFPLEYALRNVQLKSCPLKDVHPS